MQIPFKFWLALDSGPRTLCTDKRETGKDERRLLETVIEGALQQLGSLIDGGRDEFQEEY